jgi:MYXO-CTERM domain-containing protein
MRRLAVIALLSIPSTAFADVVSGHVNVGNATEPAARHALASLDARTMSAALALAGTDRFGDGDTILRFEQTHLGLPVIGRGAAVRIDAHGIGRMAVVDLESSLPASIAPAISASDAARTSQRMTILPVKGTDAHLVIAATPAGGKLAWAVIPPMVSGLPTAPRILVDAITGDVLEARDLIVYLNQASVYQTNPVTSMLAMRDLPIVPDDVNGYLANPFIVSENCVDNKTVKTVSFGPFMLPVHICDLEQRAKADVNKDFIYTPIDDPQNPATRTDEFSEVSMYFHANRAYEFFRGLQGDPNAQVVVDKPLRTISNLQLPTGLQKGDIQSAGNKDLPLDPFQNAFFSPAGGQLGMIFQTLYGFNAGAMWFGQGPKHDYSYDGDVVYHEFTHGVVDDTLKLGAWHVDSYGAIDAPGAMNEGLADYFSSALAGDAAVGEYASKDISSALNSIRNIDNADDCMGTIVGEVHFDSTFFSGGLWATRKSLSDSDKPKYDAALYKAMRLNSGKGDLGYEDLVKLFLATLKTDLPNAATALETEMTMKRGILPGCTRIFPWQGKLLYPKKNDPLNPGFWAGPSKGNFMGMPATPPGMLQVKVDLAEPTANMTVTFHHPIQQGGNLLGMMGTPFTAKMLAKFGAPITWTTKGNIAHDADVSVDCTSDGNKMLETWTATFDVPADATVAYLQVSNVGDQDGEYGDIQITTTPAEPMPMDDAGVIPPKPVPTPVTGCSCNTPGSPAGSAGALLGLGLAGLLAFRRRR